LEPRPKKEGVLKMERKRTFLIVLLSALLSVYLIAPANVSGAETVTITGRVWADECDEDGKVLGVVIKPTLRECYKVFPDAKGRELIRQVYKKVTVTGTVTKDSGGRKILTVTAYEVIKKRKT
jgi:hypothetical protein